MGVCESIAQRIDVIAAEVRLWGEMKDAPTRLDLAPVPAVQPSPAIVKAPLNSGFKFGKVSEDNLATVKPRLQVFARELLRRSPVDFRVIEGLRSIERQRSLFNSGASQTMNSRHLTGDAIDLVAWIDGEPDWDWDNVFAISAHAPAAAQAAGLKVRWGAAWHIGDIRRCAVKADPGRTMVELYKQARRAQGRKVFLDGVHYEIPR